MTLVKSLLLSSAVGITAVASAQAADLPFRKAAPVEYVRVCDFTGAGYFYIPGSDTCLKIGGYLRAEYAYVDTQRSFAPTATAFSATLGAVSALNPLGRVATGTLLSPRQHDTSGFRAEGRVEVDTRTQTAYGTLRTFVRMQFDRDSGTYSPAALRGNGYIDKGFIQFAGITAGRVQSFFDFYADNYNFEGIANSDFSTQVLAYTATFGGGFSATISAEDSVVRRDGIGQSTDNFFDGTGPFNAGTTNVVYNGERIPDVVGAIRVDQAWGAAQLSAVYHRIETNGTTQFLGDLGAAAGIPAVQSNRDADGFAVQGGIQIKLPMLAAGDDIWLEGAYQRGAYFYMDSSNNLNNGFYGQLLGGFQHLDADAYAYANADGSYSLSLSEGFSAMAAFHHYFTPNFSDVLFGSYEEVSYGTRAKNTDWTLGGIGDASEYRIGNDFVWTPVNNLSIGVEVLYSHIDQTLAHAPGVAPTALPAGIKKDPSAFTARLRIERDF